MDLDTSPTNIASATDNEAHLLGESLVRSVRTYLLPAVLDIGASELLRDVLSASLRDGNVTLDGHEVERVSTPCLQVLAAAAMGARAGGIGFRLIRPSSVLQAAIADLDLARAIPEEV